MRYSISLAMLMLASVCGNGQTLWGNNQSRTESRDNASLQDDAGAVSGFFETDSPIGYPVDPDHPAPSWFHLLDVRHSNVSNNFSMQFTGSFYTQNLYFRKTSGNPNTPWSRFLTEREGKVGIGTTNPLAELQFGDRFNITNGGWKGLQYNMVWDNTVGTNVQMVNAPAAAMLFTDQANIVFFNAPAGTPQTAISDGQHSMIIHRSGQVGIVTSYLQNGFDDISSKLFVKAGIRARKVKVDQANWADHVFDTDYKLMPLVELEAYIQKNRHLPDIPSASEVISEGQDLGEMNRILLQKIEELTLYILEQEERMNKQEEKIENLLKKVSKDKE